MLRVFKLVCDNDTGEADTLEEFIADHLWFVEMDEVTRHGYMKMETAKGVVGSLTKKGLVEHVDYNSETGAAQLVLTEEGARTIWLIIAEEEQRLAEFEMACKLGRKKRRIG